MKNKLPTHIDKETKNFIMRMKRWMCEDWLKDEDMCNYTNGCCTCNRIDEIIKEELGLSR